MNSWKKLVKIGITEKKDENFSEWYTQTVLKAELIDYSQVKGFIILTSLSDIKGITIVCLPEISIVISPITSPAFIGAAMGFWYSIYDFINFVCSKESVVTISFLTIKLTVDLFPSQTSTSLIIWFFVSIFLGFVSRKAQFIKLDDSFKRERELFVPLITTITLLPSIIAEQTLTPELIFIIIFY